MTQVTVDLTRSRTQRAERGLHVGLRTGEITHGDAGQQGAAEVRLKVAVGDVQGTDQHALGGPEVAAVDAGEQDQRPDPPGAVLRQAAHVLVAADRRMRRAGGRLTVVVAFDGNVEWYLALSGTDRALELTDQLEAEAAA